MSHVRNPWLTLLPLVLVLGIHASAQTDQFLPEIDVYYKLNSDLRIWFQAKQTREAGDPTSAEIGPSLDFYLKSWLKLKDVTAFDLDDSKARPIIFSVGYRYLPYPNAPSEDRFEPVVTFNFPIKGRLLLSDRNRADLDWKSGDFSWRYRNRVQFERTARIHSYHLRPYASVEFFYESQYEMERHCNLCRLPISHRQACSVRPLLRASEQYRQEPKSAVEAVWPDT